MSDLRVSLDPVLSAFGVPATVTRPAPDNTPVSTTGVFIRPLQEEQVPHGINLQRREPRRIFVMKRSASLATMPPNTLIVAAEELGGTPVTWRVDGFDEVESDCWRAIVVPARTA